MAEKRRPATKQKDEGKELEFRVARVEFAEGAFVRTQVPVAGSTTPGRETLTDIDVLALDFDLRLRQQKSIYECKSTRGEAGEADRLLWLCGFKTYLRADRGVLVRQTVTTRGRDLARALGLETFDVATLERREQEHAWLPRAFGHVGGEACARREKRALTQLKALGEFPGRLVQFLWNGSLLATGYQILGGLMTLGSTVREMTVLPDPAGQIVASHALHALVLAGLRAGARLDEMPTSDLKRMVEVGLMTGDPNDTQVLRTLEIADALFRSQLEALHDTYTNAGAKRMPFDLESTREAVAQLPGWTDRFIDLAERFRASAATARELPQTIELAFFDALLGDDHWKADAFSHLFTPEHRQLLGVAVAALEAIVGDQLTNRIRNVLDLPFDRSAPKLAERRIPYDGEGEREPNLFTPPSK